MSKKKLDYKLTPTYRSLLITTPEKTILVSHKITPIKKIDGYRRNKLTLKLEKVDEKEKEYLKNLSSRLPDNADYIQDIYKRMKEKKKV